MSDIMFRERRPDLDQVEVTLDGGESWYTVAGLSPSEMRRMLGDSEHRMAAPVDFEFGGNGEAP